MLEAAAQAHALPRRSVLIGGVAAALSGCFAKPDLAPTALSADLAASVQRYASFGDQRTGGPADRFVASWLRGELEQAGLAVREDVFTVDQLLDPDARLTVGELSLQAFPQWRFPTPSSGVVIRGRLAALSEPDLRGAIALAMDPVPTGAYWPAASDAPVLDAARRGAAAVVAAPAAPNGGLFAYNRDNLDPDFPIPVLLIRPGDLAALRPAIGSEIVAETTSHPATVTTSNIIGEIAPRGGDARRLVISTPRTGWFQCGGERGGGVALWIALAGFAKRRLGCAVTLIASTGHEIGHIGMKRFMEGDAPEPEAVTLWIHLGASIAARRNGYPTVVPSAQQVFLPGGTSAPDAPAFSSIGFTVRPSEPGSPGETGEISERGYAPLIGFAGHHPSFHTPEDTGDSVDPDVLAAVQGGLEATLARYFS